MNSHALDGRCVLVVEDQYLVADEIRRMIIGMGGDVNASVDFALLDINLGDGDAYPVAAELMRREVPFIFATGYEPWVIPEAFRSVPRLDKPLTPKTLADAVQRLGL
jgi:DNA-binding LytR/AlgR family response regulator